MSHPASNWLGIGFGLALSCFAAFQLFKLPPALPLLLADFGYDRTLGGALMSVYALAGLFFSLAFGRAIARRGPAPLVLAALAAMLLGGVVSLAAPQNGWVMLAGRSLEGVAFAILAIAGPVLASHHASPRHLPLVIGMIAAWIPVGQIAATLLAPLAFPIAGWRSLWLLALLGCLGLALWTLRLRRVGLLDLAAAGHPTDGARPGLRPPQRLALVLVALIFLLWSGQFFAYMTWLPQYLVEIHDLSVTAALAGYLLPVAVLLLLTVGTGALLAAGVPLLPLLIAALLSQAVVWWLLPLTAGGGWAGIASLVAYGIGAGISPACLFAMPNAVIGSGPAAATGFAVIMTGRSLGAFIGPIAMAEIAKLSSGWSGAVPVFAGSTTLAVAIALGLAVLLAAPRRHRLKAPDGSRRAR